MIQPLQRQDRNGKKWTAYKVRWEDADGTERSRTLPRGSTREDARAFERRVLNLKRLGYDPREEIERGRETLSDFAAEWWERYAGRNLARSTLERYAQVWNAHIRDRLGGYTLRELNPDVVADFRERLEDAGVGQATIRKALSLLQGMLRQAVAWRRIPSNPVQLVDKPPAERERDIVVLAPEQVERLRANVLAENREGRGHRDATLISLLAYAGPRPWSEAVRLEQRAIAKRTMQVWATKTRRSRRRARTVDLLGPLVQDLAEWRMAQGRPGPRELVLQGSGPEGAWTDSDVRNWRRRVWQPALEACDLDTAMVPYDLRHSFASLLIHEGRDIAYIADQLGHSPSQTLGTYTHVMRELQGVERVPAEEQIRRAREQLANERRAI